MTYTYAFILLPFCYDISVLLCGFKNISMVYNEKKHFRIIHFISVPENTNIQVTNEGTYYSILTQFHLI